MSPHAAPAALQEHSDGCLDSAFRWALMQLGFPLALAPPSAFVLALPVDSSDPKSGEYAPIHEIQQRPALEIEACHIFHVWLLFAGRCIMGPWVRNASWRGCVEQL